LFALHNKQCTDTNIVAPPRKEIDYYIAYTIFEFATTKENKKPHLKRLSTLVASSNVSINIVSCQLYVSQLIDMFKPEEACEHLFNLFLGDKIMCTKPDRLFINAILQCKYFSTQSEEGITIIQYLSSGDTLSFEGKVLTMFTSFIEAYPFDKTVPMFLINNDCLIYTIVNISMCAHNVYLVKHVLTEWKATGHTFSSEEFERINLYGNCRLCESVFRIIMSMYELEELPLNEALRFGCTDILDLIFPKKTKVPKLLDALSLTRIDYNENDCSITYLLTRLYNIISKPSFKFKGKQRTRTL
jgi:hypothetical protein